jgi:hypothetical protein
MLIDVMLDESLIRKKYRMLAASFTERTRRLWAATEARLAGRGGFAAVVRATGMSPTTLSKAGQELDKREAWDVNRVRRHGGGRKRVEVKIPQLKRQLIAMVESSTRGDPQSPLRWTSKSTRHIEQELQVQGYDISHVTVARLLTDADYSLRGNKKTIEGTQHPDRNAQFEYINSRGARQLKGGNPLISVDTKKKELVGAYKNAGREWRVRGNDEKVLVHDFIDPKKGKAIPYGVYELDRNRGWVSVGITHDTASFAVETIRKWWRHMGKPAYRHATSLMITADSGGSNGARVRLWKYELQRFANASGLTLHVSHFPPGTSKWNKIEHRLFSFITKNWRGKPLKTQATIVNLIANTRTTTGLRVRCVLDRRHYPKGVQITPEQMERVRIVPHAFHGEWNYTIKPHENL